jgi:hypothetical protein
MDGSEPDFTSGSTWDVSHGQGTEIIPKRVHTRLAQESAVEKGARDSRLRRVHARLISPSGEVGEVLRGEGDGTGGDVLLQVSKGASAGDSQGDWREG